MEEGLLVNQDSLKKGREGKVVLLYVPVSCFSIATDMVIVISSSIQNNGDDVTICIPVTPLLIIINAVIFQLSWMVIVIRTIAI